MGQVDDTTSADGVDVEILHEEGAALGTEEVVAAAECQGVPGAEEGEDADDRVSHVLGEDVDDVLGTSEACLDEREARLHEEDQTAGDEHPDVVEDRLDLGCFLSDDGAGHEGNEGSDATDAGDDSKRSIAHGFLQRIGVGENGICLENPVAPLPSGLRGASYGPRVAGSSPECFQCVNWSEG